MPKFNHIDKIGTELEGFFENIPDPENTYLNHVKGDGSVGWETNAEETMVREKNLLRGERNSRPTPVNEISKLRKWIHRYYPVICNRTCGLHVHVSFKRPEIQRTVINSQAFHGAFIAAAQKFVVNPKHKFKQTVIDRVLKGSSYSRLEYATNPGHGSHAIHPVTDHGTTEFRIFSGDVGVRQAKLIITFIVDFIENFLDEHFQKKAAEKIGIVYKSYNGQSL